MTQTEVLFFTLLDFRRFKLTDFDQKCDIVFESDIWSQNQTEVGYLDYPRMRYIEKQPGLSHSKIRGFQESPYPYDGFIRGKKWRAEYPSQGQIQY